MRKKIRNGEIKEWHTIELVFVRIMFVLGYVKGREANHSGYCQRCDKYRPRARERHLNKKKQELEKIRKNERY